MTPRQPPVSRQDRPSATTGAPSRRAATTRRPTSCAAGSWAALSAPRTAAPTAAASILLATTRHDRFAREDYAALRELGIGSVRDGLRWHLIETAPGRYDWSSFLPMLKAAAATGTQVVWDLCHYGWPEDLDVFSPAFVDRFARFAAAAAGVVREAGDDVPFYCPVNEISFFAWKAGDMGGFYPGQRGRGDELKRQLVRASIAAIDAVRAVDPRARFVQVDPMIQVHAGADTARSRDSALNYTAAQFQAWDMLAGLAAPELGGRPDCLDIIGVNYYDDNQWVFGGGTVPLGDPRYRPMRELLVDVAARYNRPLLVAETGCEGEGRMGWLRYVGGETRAAMLGGVPILGICLYPITHYPGWDNNRQCACGVMGPRRRHRPPSGRGRGRGRAGPANRRSSPTACIGAPPRAWTTGR